MARQTTLFDVAAQRMLTECAAGSTEREDDTPTTEWNLLNRTHQRTTDVAAEHFADLAVETIEEKKLDRLIEFEMEGSVGYSVREEGLERIVVLVGGILLLIDSLRKQIFIQLLFGFTTGFLGR